MSSSCPSCASVNCQCQEQTVTENVKNRAGHFFPDTVNDLRAVPWSAANRVAYAAGREAAFDGNGKIWLWDQDSNGTDDNTPTTSFVASFDAGGKSGRWRPQT